jgi:hypothetical protein
MMPLLAASLLFALGNDTIPALTTPQPAAVTAKLSLSTDTVPRRRAIRYSDWYGRRLTVHRYGSYAMLPLFVAQYALGSTMLSQKEGLYAGTRLVPIDENLRTSHKFVAGGVGALFAVNTTTGLWNLYASRKDPVNRTLRLVHAFSMLASDAGFAATGIALGSVGVATFGASLMWFSGHD